MNEAGNVWPRVQFRYFRKAEASGYSAEQKITLNGVLMLWTADN